MLSILAALLMQAGTPAQPIPIPPVVARPGPGVLTNPDWLRRPSGADMMKYYPAAAAAARIEGRVVLHCGVTAQGELADCVVSDASPAGQGFSEAAMGLAPLFKMRPMTRDGVPIAGGKINIPIRFVVPPAPAPTLEVALECYGAVAAAAERDPAAETAQAQVFLWRVVVEALSLPEKQRPSQLEGRLASARKMGETPGGGQAAHPQCDQIIPPAAAAGLISQFKLPVATKP